MAIKTELIPVVQPRKPQFPCLRRYKGSTSDSPQGELVVLFTSHTRGVALSGAAPGRIGVTEEWTNCDSPVWELTSIKLVSEN